MYQILLVEDDKALNKGIVLALENETINFISTWTLKGAKEIVNTTNIDMILLDLNLPDGDGYELLKLVRKTSSIPVMLITANDMEINEVMGFRLGADDYITKPFSLAVLRARVERLMQRTFIDRNINNYEDGHYLFRFDDIVFQMEGQKIELSKAEQKLLLLLVKNKDKILTREILSEAIWDNEASFVDENALSVNVNRLRKKLSSRDCDCPIETVYGIGYIWKSRCVS